MTHPLLPQSERLGDVLHRKIHRNRKTRVPRSFAHPAPSHGTMCRKHHVPQTSWSTGPEDEGASVQVGPGRIHLPRPTPQTHDAKGPSAQGAGSPRAPPRRPERRPSHSATLHPAGLPPTHSILTPVPSGPLLVPPVLRSCGSSASGRRGSPRVLTCSSSPRQTPCMWRLPPLL